MYYFFYLTPGVPYTHALGARERFGSLLGFAVLVRMLQGWRLEKEEAALFLVCSCSALHLVERVLNVRKFPIK